MALVVFLRGVNVGGHRRFRPSELVHQLRAFDVVNIGAAGTLVVRQPGGREAFRKALARQLPFTTAIALCEGRELLRLERENPFAGEPCAPGVVRFLSVLTAPPQTVSPLPPIPFALPPDDDWLVRIVGAQGRFRFGEYRRAMKTIGYLGQLDRCFGAPATTRNWNTVLTITRRLRQP